MNFKEKCDACMCTHADIKECKAYDSADRWLQANRTEIEGKFFENVAETCQLPTNKLAGLQLRKMFSRRIWPVDFGPVRPHKSTRLDRNLLATYFEKCPQIRISSQELLPPCLSKHCLLRTPIALRRISPVYRSAQTSCEVDRRSLIQLLSKKNIDMREYKDIGTGNQQRGTLLSRLKSRVSAAPTPRGFHEVIRPGHFRPFMLAWVDRFGGGI